ncbi:hypothetical protein ACFQJ8_11345 [Halocatena marina]
MTSCDTTPIARSTSNPIFGRHLTVLPPARVRAVGQIRHDPMSAVMEACSHRAFPNDTTISTQPRRCTDERAVNQQPVNND